MKMIRFMDFREEEDVFPTYYRANTYDGPCRARAPGRALERENAVGARAPVILFRRAAVRRRTRREPLADSHGRGALRRQRDPWRLPQAYAARAVSTSTIFSTLTMLSICSGENW